VQFRNRLLLTLLNNTTEYLYCLIVLAWFFNWEFSLVCQWLFAGLSRGLLACFDRGLLAWLSCWWLLARLRRQFLTRVSRGYLGGLSWLFLSKLGKIILNWLCWGLLAGGSIYYLQNCWPEREGVWLQTWYAVIRVIILPSFPCITK